MQKMKSKHMFEIVLVSTLTITLLLVPLVSTRVQCSSYPSGNGDFGIKRKLPIFAQKGPVELIVGLNDKVENCYAKVKGLAAEYGCEIVDTISRKGKMIAVVINATSAASFFEAEVEATSLSTYVEPNYEIKALMVPNDPLWEYQWGPQKIQADWAWNTTIGDPSVLVAVIDTGVDWDHPDLAANYVALGYDWVNNDTDPMDDNGHGTHCAGIIAAVTNNNVGIAGLAQVRIMAEKVLNHKGRGNISDVANGIYHAVNQSAKIISMSLGAYFNYSTIYNAIKYAYNEGVLLVAAVGNDFTNTRLYPAAYDEVVAVAATDEIDGPAWFTNYGDWIELSAPGVNIISTFLADSYIDDSGTSMACPHVSGAAALIWSQYPNMTRDDVRNQLRFTADDLGTEGFDEFYGWGRINARRAVEEVQLEEHDLGIIGWEVPSYVLPGTTVHVKTKVFNFGLSDEFNVRVELKIYGILYNYDQVSVMPSGTSVVFNTSCTPPKGVYKIESRVVQVPGETRTSNNIVRTSLTVREPNVLKVPQNYTTIQSAIDVAIPLDIIQVSSGTYYEHIVVNKPLISIIGQNKDTTVIDGSQNGTVVTVIRDEVTISGFTIQNSGPSIWSELEYCVSLRSSGNNITDNRVKNGHEGIGLLGSSDNTIDSNIVTQIEDAAIVLFPGSRNNISQNTITSSYFGIASVGTGGYNKIYKNYITSNIEDAIFMWGGPDNEIIENKITSNLYGITSIGSYKTNIKGNFISENGYGLYLLSATKGKVYHNTMANNYIGQIYIESSSISWSGRWDVTGNYWSDYKGTDSDGDGIGDTPYVIDENNVDHHPLMNPWLPGDVNNSGYVDMRDIGRIAWSYGTHPGDPRWNPRADLDENAVIDWDDIAIAQANFGKTWQKYWGDC